MLPRPLFFDALLSATVQEFNPRYDEAEGALFGQFRHLHTDIHGIPVPVIECKNVHKDEGIALEVDQIGRHHRESPELFVSQPLFTATQHHRLFLRGDLEHGAAEYPSPRGNAPPPSQPGAPPREKRPLHPEG